MRELLTPSQVARAIQVSESSVKRWCDQGLINTCYTAGGHRRISRTSFLSFLRLGKHQLLSPDIVGLPVTTGKTVWVLERAAVRMREGLVANDDQLCRQIILDLFLANQDIADICDLVFAPAFSHIGTMWECGEAEVYQERRACEITSRLLHELRQSIPAPAPGAGVALGGSLSGNPYDLATTMAEIVLRDLGWDASSLGSNLPFQTMEQAIITHQPKLFWLNCSHIENRKWFVDGIQELHARFHPDVVFLAGGRALSKSLMAEIKCIQCGETMKDLVSFARTLLGS